MSTSKNAPLNQEDQIHQLVVGQLSALFNLKKQKNSRYSLRSFAKYLNLSPATLSVLLNNKRRITADVFKTVKHKIDLTDSEKNSYLSYLQRRKKQRKGQFETQNDIDRLAELEFELLSEWYFFALIELFKLNSFKKDPNWIKNELGLKSDFDIDSAIQLLKDLKLIKETEKGYQDLAEYRSLIDENLSTEARRKRQKQILALSSKSINHVDYAHRDHSAITIAFDPMLMPEVKKRIMIFRRSLANYITENSLKKNSIYELQVSFFPLKEHS